MIDLYDGFAGTVNAPTEGPAVTGSPDVKPVKATGGNQHFHGSLGDPGYHLLHPGNKGKGKRKLPEPRGGMVGSPDFTEEEHLAALDGYIDAPRVNAYLRGGGGDEETARQAHALNDLIDIQEPLQAEQKTFRGGLKLPEMQPGDTFDDRGFTSTTDDPDVADIFSMAPVFQGGEKGDILHITLPPGTQALQVASVRAHGSEGEWILRPGATLRVTGITDDGYEVEVVTG
jgi:hypothetical protein